MNHIQLKLRGRILRWVNQNSKWLPIRVHFYLLTRLPFGLSIIDLTSPSPLSEAQIAELVALARKYNRETP